MHLSKLIIVIFIILSTHSYSQKPLFSKNGTQKNGSSKIDTIINTSFIFKANNNKNFIFRHIANASDTIKIENQKFALSRFNIKIDTAQFDYFFLLKIGKDSIEFCPQDGDLMTVKEAKNNQGIWRPTQFWIFSDCGNSYYPYYTLKNCQLAIIKANKDNGNYLTTKRLRFRLYPNTIIISDPYFSSINLSDFFINEIDTFHRDMIKYRPEYFSYLPK